MDSTWIIPLLVASFVALLGLRWFDLRRRRRRRIEYQQLLRQALDDGVLTPEELEELESVRARGDLKPDEVRMAALAIYRGALRDAAADARLTPDEDAVLTRLQEQLGLTERDLGSDLPQLSRLRMLARVAGGKMPEVHAPVSLVPDERCHWVVQCTLAERIALPDVARRKLAGPSFRVVSNEPFAATGSRDALRPAADILPSDVGVLIVTSRRIIFQGARRTVSVPHARAEMLELYADGVRLDEISHVRSRYFLMDDPELACAIMLQAARIRRAEIRPARPHRSA
ncbi:MAG TPA: hypothetical protein VHG09_05815 [Longimicrobiales bacterium]|nr:hypothetical protein [Longimicrobiales bacterium]